jgi:4-hydroxy-tetrahydrodipicolinate synthase
MITPFTEEGRIDRNATGKIIEHLMAGETIPFVLGTTGESASIPSSYRSEFVKTVVESIAGRSKIYAGISGNSLNDTIELGKTFSDLGVDVFVAHLPSYYPLTEDQIIKYYEALAEKLPNPLIIYNIPATTHISIPLDIIEKLSYHPNITGLKDSERDLQRLENSINKWKNRSDFSHFIGWAAQSAHGLLLGSNGLVPSTGNICPNLFFKLYQAATKDDKAMAQKFQEETDNIARIYQGSKTIGQTIAALKAIMSQMGLCEPFVLPPLDRLNLNEEASILGKASKMGLKSE